MKRIISTIILAAMLMAIGSPIAAAAAAGGTLPFPDVPEGIWYYEYVRDLYWAGVIGGCDDGTYSGNKDVSWGEVFKLILLTIGCETPDPVEGEHWAYPYIELAIENKLVYEFDKENLNGAPTRLEVAQMTARALDLVSIAGGSPYADCDDGYVVKLYEKGIMVGVEEADGSRYFLPDQPIKRSEIAAILWRVREYDVTEGMFRYSNYWLDVLPEVEPMGYDTDLFSREGSAMTYSGCRTALGVDVSGYQKDIDWEAVKADGIDFAIIRVGGRFMQSGELYDDSYFVRNIEGALAAGLDVGVYFFSQAITAEEGLEEAEYVLERIQGYDVTYPVVCDWEYLGGSTARTYGVEPADITAGIAAFCERVAQEGYEPMLYFNSYCGYIKMDLRQLTDYGFWFAEYTDVPSCIYHFQMWQYSSKGQVNGIPGNVDMDICFVPYT